MQAMFNKNYRKSSCPDAERRKKMSGFSLIEIVIVLVIIGVLTAISLPSIYNYKKKYKSEDQALKIMDLMRETSQLALTRRRTMRFEIDLTNNAALIIDENGTSPDTRIKFIPLELPSELRVDRMPTATGVAKPAPPTYNDAAFAADALGHKVGAATVIGNTVWAVRFSRNGTAVNAADVPISANLYVWSPLTPGSTTPRDKTEIRAITLFGGSGAIRYWKHNGTTFVPY